MPVYGRVHALLVLALLTSSGWAQDDGVREEVVDGQGRVVGSIDWTEGQLSAWGEGATQTAALDQARTNLYQVLLVVTVDAATCVGDQVRLYEGLAADLRALTGGAPTTKVYPTATASTWRRRCSGRRDSRLR